MTEEEARTFTTKDSLQGKSLALLRDIAKELKIPTVGKNIADLGREIVQVNVGKSEVKAAKTNGVHATQTVLPFAAPPDEKLSAQIAEVKALVETYIKSIVDIRAVISELANNVGEPTVIPKGWKAAPAPQASSASAPEAEEAPKAKRAPGRPRGSANKVKPVVAKAPKEEEEDEGEEEDAIDCEEAPDSEEEGEEAGNITPEMLADMSLPQLIDVVEQIHDDESIMARAKDKKIDIEASSPRVLRQRIIEFLGKYAEVEEDEDEDKGKDISKDTGLPEFIVKGAKVEADFGEKDKEEWIRGVVTDVDRAKKSATMKLDDGSTGDAPWKCIRPLQRVARAR